ncbi:MAG: glycogen debranching protein, partial [Magnetospirillum sp.]
MDQAQIRIPVQTPTDPSGREWMIANGLAGYASGALDGGVNRRHDGLLVAALPRFGRTILLDRIEETVRLPDGSGFALFAGSAVEFRLETGLPVWRFECGDVVLERRVVMPYRQNTTIVAYRLLAGDGPVTLEIRPWMHFRGNDGQADQPLHMPAVVHADGGRVEVTQGPYPPLRLATQGGGWSLALDGGRTEEAFYSVEAERDYVAKGPIWSPGMLTLEVGRDGAALVASSEPWPTALALTADQALAAEAERRGRLIARAHSACRDGVAALLVAAADAFLFDPRGRFDLVARANAVGDDVRSVIAGYPWFNDWGRDTMISLEGLTLVTGRPDDAKWILRTFASYERDGLIPNNIPD